MTPYTDTHFQARLDISQDKILDFVSTETKHLVFLISVGQPYHYDRQLKATIDLFSKLIRACVDATKVTSMFLSERERQSKLMQPWHIKIVVADCLQSYNDDKGRAYWRRQGQCFINETSRIFSNLLNAYQPSPLIQLKMITWEEVIKLAKCFQFDDYFRYLNKIYSNPMSADDKAFVAAVNVKGHHHQHRMLNKKSKTKREICAKQKKIWSQTNLEKNRLTYILEEYAVLLGSLTQGCLFYDASSIKAHQLKSKKNILLVYPGDEESAFKRARITLDEYNKISNIPTLFGVSFTGIHLSQIENIAYPNRYDNCDSEKLLGFSNPSVTRTSENTRSFCEKLNACLFRNVTRKKQPISNYNLMTKINVPSWPFKTISYVQRYDLEKKLSDIFQARENIKKSKTVIINIHGLSGYGKTALMYHYSHSSRFTRAIWCESTSRKVMNFSQAFLSIAQTLQILVDDTNSKKMIQTVKLWLEKHPGWLLIFDDVKSYKMVKPYIPEEGGYVMISSQHRLLNDVNIKSINVGPMSLNEATTLLQQMIRQPEVDEQQCHSLIIALASCPLAIIQAGAYIKQNNLSIGDYLQELLKAPTSLLKDSSHQFYLEDNETEQQKAVHVVAKTWQLTVDTLGRDEKHPHTQGLINTLLNCCAYLNHHDIPVRSLKIWVTKLMAKCGNIEQIIIDHAIEQALQKLNDYCLISVSTDQESLSINPLLQRLMHAKHETLYLSQSKKSQESNKINTNRQILKVIQTDDFFHTAMITLHDQLEGSGKDTISDRKQQNQLLIHSQQFIEHIESIPTGQLINTPAFANLCAQVGMIHHRNRDDQQMATLLRKAKPILDKISNAERNNDIYGDLLCVISMNPKYFPEYNSEQISQLFDRSIQIRQQQIKASRTAGRLRRLANAYTNQARQHDLSGQYDQSLRELTKCKLIYHELYAEEDNQPLVLKYYYNLALIHRKLNNEDEVKNYLGLAKEIGDRLYPDGNDLTLMKIYSLLAYQKIVLGDIDGAVNTLNQQISIAEQLPSDLWSYRATEILAEAYDRLGWCHAKLSRPDDALRCYQTAIEKYGQCPGMEHSNRCEQIQTKAINLVWSLTENLQSNPTITNYLEAITGVTGNKLPAAKL